MDAISSTSIVRNQRNLSGTTEVVADFICAAVEADKYLIRTEAVYLVDCDAVISQNHREYSDKFFLPLKDQIENREQYEVIFVGYPIWSSITPMAFLSFLNEYDLLGKTILPFATHNGYGAGRSFTAVRNACPNSTTLDGLSLSSADVHTSQTNINQWIDRIGVKDLIGIDTPIRVTAGNTVMDGMFYGTELAREIMGMLPITVNMGAFGGLEYYGLMPSRPAATEEGQLRFDNGDITYCPQNNTIAIFMCRPAIPILPCE